ncbi:DUF805 domain-containing protein [Spirabiliibacterium falconis]|uniref:DUF805 domain-containing protein n=1 Tax=Spirabiliibacterium falconis TaxID=572023 RepID=UPI001AAC50C5|nr:DUF805 domain-containing protein [Spirabiliibacterium falconis]MBE2894503.1 DUF805 domain-containing protein [Spirabiliibacterium falconis]
MTLWQLLFSFHGRLNRTGFWQGVSICALALLIIANVLPLNALFAQTHTALLASMMLLVILFCFCAVVVKRLHDRNRSGWAVLMITFPILGYVLSQYSSGAMAWALGRFFPLFFITLFLLDWGVFLGKNEPNRYGSQGVSLKWNV